MKHISMCFIMTGDIHNNKTEQKKKGGIPHSLAQSFVFFLSLSYFLKQVFASCWILHWDISSVHHNYRSPADIFGQFCETSIKRLPNDATAGICISSLAFASVRRDLIGSKRANSPDQNQSKVPLSSFKGACLTSVFPQEERTKGDDGDSWPGMTKTDTKENITPQGYIMAADASSSSGMASESFLFERRE